MHCLIIDDRKDMVPGLISMLKRLPDIGAIHTACNALEAEYLLKTVNVAIVICVPQLWNHGFSTLFGPGLGVVFTTNNKNMIKDEGKTSGLTLIKEPWNQFQLQSAITVVLSDTEVSDHRFMLVKFERRWRRVTFADLELIEKKPGNYVLICTRQCNYLVAGTLNAWLKKLPAGEFVRPCDGLIIPVSELPKLTGEIYTFRGRDIRLTFRFARKAKKEMEAAMLS